MASKPIDLFALMAAFAREQGVSLTDGTLVDRFLADAKPKLEAALQDRRLIHGTRTERQFEALVVTLGGYKLLKAEDLGRLHTDDSCRAPDFRIVLHDDTQWLVEVKNVHCEEPSVQETKLTGPYLASLKAYCDLMGVPLRIAIYWSKWQFWSLVDPEKFRTPSGGAQIEMGVALMHNELARLGDVWLCTQSPLRLVLEADPNEPMEAAVGGEPRFKSRAERFFSGDTELVDDRSRRLAWILMQYGEWGLEGPTTLRQDGVIVGAEFVASPRRADTDCVDDEPAMMGSFIGQASRIFARYFATETTEGDAILQLDGRPTPEWFSPVATWDFKSSPLPLWVLHMQPPAVEAAGGG